MSSNYLDYMKYKEKFGDKLTAPQNVKAAYTSMSGRVKIRDLFVGFYNVKEAKNAK